MHKIYEKHSTTMKSKKIAAVLALLFGGIGIHRFYLGQTVKGVISLIFFWTYVPLFISIIDFIVFIVMSEEKFNIMIFSTNQVVMK